MTRLDTDSIGAMAALPPSGLSRCASQAKPAAAIARAIDDLLAIKTAPVEWLEQAGPIAAKLNEQSLKDIPE